MFYSEAILSKKGPLAKVWLAAHWERKLTKNQFLQTNLHSSVDAIMGADQAPMALRLSGQLLLGVARIYSRKTRYLLEDCNEALVKIKVAFRSDASNKGDSNLLTLDGNVNDLGTDHAKAAAAFNAITVPDAMTEFDLLLPARAIDISAWGLNPKSSHLSGLRDITLEEGNADDLFSTTGDYHTMDHGRRNLGLDIEVGRNQMNRIGGGGYDTMDFDLVGPDDALDLDMFGDDVALAGEFDFLKRPHRRDDLEIEVGRRDTAISRRSPGVDPFGMLTAGDKQGPLRLGEGSEDGRASSVHDQPAFDDFIPAQEGARAPVHFEIADAAEAEQQGQQATIKKRKLVVDDETEMSQDRMMGMNADLVADGLLTTHEMLPRSRKMLRLQQIEQDIARGGLAGYLLDCTAGPRVMGSALVPELASMFSRSLQIVQEAPAVQDEEDTTTETRKDGSTWQKEQVESWMDQVDNEPDFSTRQTTLPPADTFDGFQLDSPRRDRQGETEDNGEGPSTNAPIPTRPSLFQEIDETEIAPSITNRLHGTDFSTSTIQTMRLVQQGIESKRSDGSEQDSTPRVTFSELMTGPNKSQQKRTRADASKLFFELLVLSTKNVVKVEQETSFGEIAVSLSV
ncbi:sister chromatid cohesion protein 1 [Mortierella sp. AD011]|nr:sister chromatid cohesion protein 1 [Mortierella sp. AD010]KAF9397389.1 sister chromatid cohesion protein 1 [Mortierella sp. AD011]